MPSYVFEGFLPFVPELIGVMPDSLRVYFLLPTMFAAIPYQRRAQIVDIEKNFPFAVTL